MGVGSWIGKSEGEGDVWWDGQIGMVGRQEIVRGVVGEGWVKKRAV